MLTVAARIPDAAARDQFADRLAHKARITEEVVRAEIRKAAVQRADGRRTAPVPALGQVKAFERGLIWALVRDPVAGFGALAELDGHRSERAGDRTDSRAGAIPAGMAVRGLTTGLTGASKYTGGRAGRRNYSAAGPPGLVAADCVVELRRLQLARERADVQREMARLLEQGISSSDQRINELGMRQLALKQQIDSIGSVQIEPARSDR